ncbi:Uncharacterized protein BM_BM4981 [Brugia malayi]|uniref:Uncharacterized protein n=1 Tax=Brugia malayi TaxID=6279 RepID=A0A4E9FUJ0_BRUMA|nr:Uncharacterized protein BM_BM4981 [Brugia malayi]VIO98160.1 Uncharacterized protein BM_BM4981 [Brugia malayi]
MNHQIKASDLVCIKDLTDAGNLHIIVHKNKIVKETDKNSHLLQTKGTKQ